MLEDDTVIDFKKRYDDYSEQKDVVNKEKKRDEIKT